MPCIPVGRPHVIRGIAPPLRGTLSLAACLLAGSGGAAWAIDVTTPVVINDASALGTDDINIEGGSLHFNVSAALENNLGFFDGKTGTVTAAPGQIVEFGPSFLGTFVGIDADSTAVFGSSTATGTILINTDFGSSHPDGRVVVAGGTLGGDIGLVMLLASAASTTVEAGATLDLNGPIAYVHNLKGSGSVVTHGGELGLIVDDGSSTEFSGTISGSSGVAIMNAGFTNGTMVLSGNNTYTGGTLVCVCATLQLGNGGASGSIVGNVTNGGVLAFNRSDIYVFTGSIEDDVFDAGSVVQMGTGTTVLTGTHTYTGDTLVEAGKLVVNGSIAQSDVTVQSGATLSGTGTLGDTTVLAGGVHAPGNSIGTQTVGDYILSAGAVLEVEINAAGQSDRVVATGTVDLTGAVLRVITEPGRYVPGMSYLIIDSAGGPISGSFATFVSPFAFLDPTVSFAGGGSQLELTLSRNATAFADVALTPNQRNVAGAIDGLASSDPTYQSVVGQTRDGARAAFDALSGEVHATLGGLLVEDSRHVRDALLGRLAQAFHSGGSPMLGGSGPAIVADLAPPGRMALGAGRGSAEPAPAINRGLTFWTHGYGSWGDYDSDGNAAAAERALGGFVSGMDAAIGASWRAGLATGYAHANSSINARRSTAEVDTYHLAAYAGGPVGALALRSGLAWSWHEIDTSRAIVFPGFTERADANYDGDTGQIFAEAALPFSSGRLAIEPFAGLAYVHTDTDGFVETGSSAALRSSGNTESVTFSTLGFRAATRFDAGGLEVMPRVSVAWQHAFDSVAPGLGLSFVSSGAGFGVSSVPLAEDAALIEAGLDLGLSADATLGISYTGQLAGDTEDHGVRGTLLWRF